jgi:hypothetical protein
LDGDGADEGVGEDVAGLINVGQVYYGDVDRDRAEQYVDHKRGGA